MFRHQPPTAMYLPLSNLKEGFGRSDQAIVRFQTALEQYLGVRACFVASSARTALFHLLQTLTKADPDRKDVLLPAYTCPVLVKVIQDVGLRPYPIDISPQTFAFDPEQLTSHLNEKILALICVHPFGIPQDIEEQITQAHAVGAFVIEDAAQAMGARWRGQPVGGRADFGLFSLGPGKPLSTGGGGVVCTNNQTQAQLLEQTWQKLPPASAAASVLSLIRLLLIRSATHPRGWWLAARSGVQSWGLSPSSWGYSNRQLSSAQARIGLAQLAELDDINQVRCENGRQLITQLQGLDFAHIPEVPPEADPIYLRLPIIFDTAERREYFYQALRSANIGSGRLYQYSLPEIFPQIEAPPCPGAVQIGQRLLTLPTHHYLTKKDIGRISDIFQT